MSRKAQVAAIMIAALFSFGLGLALKDVIFPVPIKVRNESIRQVPVNQEFQPASQQRMVLRSKHLLHGIPRPIDGRYDFVPEGSSGSAVPGISLLVREGFVVGHCDKLRVPLFVCQRWTRSDYRQRDEAEEVPDRNFREDEELPLYARAHPKMYKSSDYDRGHMAPHRDNLSWGEDNCLAGSLMSNIAPQRSALNRKAWRMLEDAHHKVVVDPLLGIEAIWVISGTVFKDGSAESALAGSVGVPLGTYKVLAWYDLQGEIHQAGYYLTQDAASSDPADYLTTVDKIEALTGLDFFSDLPDEQEEKLESRLPSRMWD